MNSGQRRPDIALLLSGGLDSAVLLGCLLSQGRVVQPLYVRSQLLWESEELRSVRAFLEAMACPRLAPLAVQDVPLADVYGDHWSISGDCVPDARSPDDAVYLPGRNPLLLVKAMVWCHLRGIGELAIGVLGSSPFADASDGFFSRFEEAMNIALGARVHVVRPFADMDKGHVMELGRHLPLGLTFSCIAPEHGRHCGRCNKCAERQAAFRLIGLPDPTPYAAAGSDRGAVGPLG